MIVREDLRGAWRISSMLVVFETALVVMLTFVRIAVCSSSSATRLIGEDVGCDVGICVGDLVTDGERVGKNDGVALGKDAVGEAVVAGELLPAALIDVSWMSSDVTWRALLLISSAHNRTVSTVICASAWNNTIALIDAAFKKTVKSFAFAPNLISISAEMLCTKAL